MGAGRAKMKGKIAGVFVMFRGFAAVMYALFRISQGEGVLVLLLIDLVLGLAFLAGGLGVVKGSKKGYLFATSLVSIDLLLSLLSLSMVIFIDVLLYGALKKGYDAEKKSSSGRTKKYSKTGRHF